MKKLFIASVFVLGVVPLAVAQEPSLVLGGVELRIGMPQATVIAQLSKLYDLKQSEPNEYRIYEKRRDKKDEDQNSIGQVAFDKGKLVYAVRDWYREDKGTGYEVVDVLNTILTQMQQTGERIASIETGAYQPPDMIVRQIEIGFGKRWITISTVDHKGTKIVQITEAIRFAPFPKKI